MNKEVLINKSQTLEDPPFLCLCIVGSVSDVLGAGPLIN